MAIDVKEKVTELVEKFTRDEALKKLFKEDPIAAVEKVLGVDLPDEQIEKIVAGVKAKLSADKLSGAAEKLKNLF